MSLVNPRRTYTLSLNGGTAGCTSQQNHRLGVLESRIEVGFVAGGLLTHGLSFGGSPIPTRAVVQKWCIVQNGYSVQSCGANVLTRRLLACGPPRCAGVTSYDSAMDSPMQGLSFNPTLMVVGALTWKRWIAQEQIFLR